MILANSINEGKMMYAATDGFNSAGEVSTVAGEFPSSTRRQTASPQSKVPLCRWLPLANPVRAGHLGLCKRDIRSKHPCPTLTLTAGTESCRKEHLHKVLRLPSTSSVFTVGCTVGKGFARKEVDGRLTTDEPLGTVSVVIHKSSLPSEITKDAYHSLLFTIDGETYSVVN